MLKSRILGIPSLLLPGCVTWAKLFNLLVPKGLLREGSGSNVRAVVEAAVRVKRHDARLGLRQCLAYGASSVWSPATPANQRVASGMGGRWEA